MNGIIQADYSPRLHHTAPISRGTAQTDTQTSFLELATQVSRRRSDTPAAGSGGTAGLSAMPARLMLDLTARSAGPAQPDAAQAAEAPSLEAMLKAKYSNLHYHVFDASSSHWRSRNDYPHYLLYQDGDKARETLENWQPVGANPFYGSIDGRFTAPKEIHALSSVPPGSKAVVIHPAVQARMEQDPAYAREIMQKIDTWFAFDVSRNEAIRPGSTLGMSQAVAIGADGNICNACSSRSGGELTISEGSDEMVRAYYLRLAKRADFMQWLARQQREDKILAGTQAASAAAKAQLAEMLDHARLLEIFGEEIAGVSTESVLAHTRTQVWSV